MHSLMKGGYMCTDNKRYMYTPVLHTLHIYVIVYMHVSYRLMYYNDVFYLIAHHRGFDDSFFAQNQAVAQFRQFASSMNVHVTLIMHPRKEDEGKPLQTSSIFGTAKATQEADNVMILQSQLNKDKYIQVHIGYYRLYHTFYNCIAYFLWCFNLFVWYVIFLLGYIYVITLL